MQRPSRLRTRARGGLAQGVSLPPSRLSLEQSGFSNIVAQWDATLTDSYSGTGTTLANVIATPADGSAQSAYDLTMSGLTFTGSAGDEAAYLATAGAGFAEIAANTTFLTNLGKTLGQDHTFIMAYEPATTVSNYLYSTQNTSSAVGTSVTSAATATQRQTDGVTSSTVSDGTIVAATRYLVISSHSHSTDRSRIYVNDRAVTEKVHIYTPHITDPRVNLHLFSRNDSAGYMPSGSKLIGAAFMNTYIDDTKAGELFDYFNDLHSVTYA